MLLYILLNNNFNIFKILKILINNYNITYVYFNYCYTLKYFNSSFFRCNKLTVILKVFFIRILVWVLFDYRVIIWRINNNSQYSSNDLRFQCITEVAELVAGYMDCMEEALRYLQEVEEYPEEHPAVQGLRDHLDRSRQKLMDQALMLQAWMSDRDHSNKTIST